MFETKLLWKYAEQAAKTHLMFFLWLQEITWVYIMALDAAQRGTWALWDRHTKTSMEAHQDLQKAGQLCDTVLEAGLATPVHRSAI